MRVGVTQRVEYITGYAESRDCLDQRWTDFLNVLRMTMIPIPNTLKNFEVWLDLMKCDAFILTGGNDLSEVSAGKNVSVERDRTEIALLTYAQSKSLPVFGVCRGLQLMNIFLGGKLDRVQGHVSKRHQVRFCFDQTNKFTTGYVNSFHNWGISQNSLAQKLIPCAYDDSNYIEAARHEKLNWLGMMWHPEREEKYQKTDLEMLQKLFYEGFD